MNIHLDSRVGLLNVEIALDCIVFNLTAFTRDLKFGELAVFSMIHFTLSFESSY